MGRTLIELDSQRQYVYEPAYMKHVSSADISTSDATSARLQKWSGTDTITLKPVNLSTDFHALSDFENLKFRLADCYYNSDWWTEVPRNNTVTGDCDYFFSAKVKNVNVEPIQSPDNYPLLNLLTVVANLTAQKAAQSLALQTLNSVGVIVSKQPLPANQGYYLRFRIDDVPSMQRAAIIDFVFGDFWLRLNGDGTAQIFQTLDFQNWQFWETFKWHDGTVHGEWHRIAIFPHARDQIEFLSRSPMKSHELGPVIQRANAEGVALLDLPDVLTTSHVFKARSSTLNPGTPPVVNPDGSVYTITKKGPWAIYVNRSFRPLIQVSELGFYNGDTSPCYAFDAPVDMGFIPTLPISMGVNADVPTGCELDVSMQAPDSVANGTALASTHRFKIGQDQAYIMSILMKGDGKIKGYYSSNNPNISSTTPEIYDYSIDKPYGIDTDKGADPQSFEVLSVSIDSGASPENESLEVSIDNSDGSVNAYTRRSHIPCRLYDEDTGITLFEGNAEGIEYSDAPASEPQILRLSVKGMTYTLQRHYPTDIDFTMGINSSVNVASNQPYTWQQAVLRCFESSGFPNSAVTIEGTGKQPNGSFTVQGRQYDFPLWAESATGKGTDPAAATGRWRPNPTKPMITFLNFLIQDCLGWHYAWDKVAHGWTVFKRPQPGEIPNLPILAAFFSNETDLYNYSQSNPTIPCYLHSEKKEKTIAPACTTIDAWGSFPHYVLPQATDLEKVLKNPVQEGDAAQPIIKPDNSFVKYRFDNPNGYQKRGGPTVDRTSPDFMRTQTIREVNLTQAANQTAFQWLGRRIFEDLCFGKVQTTFLSDWGDSVTVNLRKWSVIVIDSETFLIDRIEPLWGAGQDNTKRARYSAWLYRPGVPVPR